MPTYVYKCPKCKERFERFCLIAQRNKQFCGCGGKGEMMVVAPNVVSFKPRVMTNMTGEPYITSKHQLSEECKKREVDCDALY